MTVRIGMIGPGGMGKAHIGRIHSVIAGGRVVALHAAGLELVDELVLAAIEHLGDP